MMKMMMVCGLVLAAGGCMTDELDDDTDLGEDIAALTGVATHALTASTYQTKDLGAASRGTQCFLTSVEGDISAGIPQLSGAGAGVYADAGRWVLYARPSSGSVRAEAVCVTGVYPSSVYAWTSNQPSTPMGSSTGRRCFLTEVNTIPTQLAQGGMHTTSDVVQITQSGSTWQLGGATTGLVSAKARCISITQDDGVYSVWANAGATANSSTLLTGAATACALQRLDGHFDAEGTGLDMSRVVDPVQGSFYYWLLGATNASGGAMRCVQ